MKDSHNFYVGVSKPWLFVAIQLYWNFKLYCFYFFPNSALPNRGCGLSTDAAYTWTFTVHLTPTLSQYIHKFKGVPQNCETVKLWQVCCMMLVGNLPWTCIPKGIYKNPYSPYPYSLLWQLQVAWYWDPISVVLNNISQLGDYWCIVSLITNYHIDLFI